MIKNMKNYLIYYADQDCYEGQDRPFAVVETEERAKEICAEIINHGKSLANKLKYEYEEGISDEEYLNRLQLGDEVKDGPWPYQWEYGYGDFEPAFSADDQDWQSMCFVERTVAYKEIKKL